MITGGVLAIAVIVDSLARQSRVSHGRGPEHGRGRCKARSRRSPARLGDRPRLRAGDARGRRHGRLRRPRRGPAARRSAAGSGRGRIPLVVDLAGPAPASPGCCRASSRKRGPARHLPRQRRRLHRRRRDRGRPGRLGPDAEPQRQRRLPLDPRGPAAHGRAQDRRHRRHQLGRRRRAGGVGADLHRLEVRGAGLRPHRAAAGGEARHPRRRGAARGRSSPRSSTTGRRRRWRRPWPPAA